MSVGGVGSGGAPIEFEGGMDGGMLYEGLQRGDRGEDVTQLQQELARLVDSGDYPPDLKAQLDPGPADGIFGANTEKALNTEGYFHALDHIAVYYPSGIALNFPGYIVGFAETERRRVVGGRDELIVNKTAYAAGYTVERLLDTLRFHVPVVSQVTRPSNRLNAMPVTVAPASPTVLAGISRRTHSPVGGSGPMYRRLAVPSTPTLIRSAPQ